MATAEIKAQAVTRVSLRQRLDTGSGLMPYFLVLPTLVVIAMIAVYPIVDAIYLSLQSNPTAVSGGTFAGLQNFITVLSSPEFQNTIGVSFTYSFASVILETAFGLVIALLINKVFPGRGLVRAAILIPWAFPTIVSSLIWKLMYNDQVGIITYFLQLLHILGPGDTLLRTSGGIVIAAIITDVWKTTPFMALLLLAGLQVIPSELYEAASVDGSSRWQQFWTITMPLLLNSLLIALLFRILDAIRAFDLFYILGGSQVESIASYSYDLMFTRTNADFGPGVAAAVILFLIGGVLGLIFVLLMRRTATSRA